MIRMYRSSQNYNLRKLIFLPAGTTPILKKKLHEWRSEWKYFMLVPTNYGNRSGSCSDNHGFRIAQVVRCHSENGISHSENHVLKSESCSENTPEGTLREAREWPSHSERVLPELGWAPGFWDFEIIRRGVLYDAVLLYPKYLLFWLCGAILHHATERFCGNELRPKLSWEWISNGIPSDTKVLLTKLYSEIIILKNYEFHA